MIGCGKMGGALVAQWTKGSEDFTVLDPGLEAAPAGTRLIASADALGGEQFDVIVVAVKPQMIDDVMPGHAQRLAEGGYVLSIAAGYTAARLADVMGGASVIRTIPNLPAAIGQGVTGVYPAPDVDTSATDHAMALMERAGTAILVDSEDRLDRLTAIAGSGPGFIFEMARAWVDVGMELGFTREEARDMVLGTMGGTIAMASEPDALPLEELRNNVTSKNGTTAAGLDALNGDGGLTERLRATAKATYDRAVELR